MMGLPPGNLRATWLICRLGVRRLSNRMASAMSRRKAVAPGAPRRATPRKNAGGIFLSALSLAGMLLMGWSVWVQALAAVRYQARLADVPPDKMAVAAWFYEMVRGSDEFLRRGANMVPASDAEDAEEDAAPPGTLEQRRRRQAQSDVTHLAMPGRSVIDPQREPTAPERERFVELFSQRGSEGLVSIPRARMMEGFAIWRADAPASLPSAVLAMVTLLTVSAFLMSIGEAQRATTGIEWETGWLMHLPVASRTVFLAMIVRGALVNAWVTVIQLPLLVMLYFAAGWKAAAVPLALLGAGAVALMVSAAGQATLIGLRQRLPEERYRNIRAVSLVLGVLLLFSAYAFSFGAMDIAWLMKAALRFPRWLAVLPWCLPVTAAQGGAVAVAAIGGVVLMAVGSAELAARRAGKAVSRGFVVPSSSKRRSAAPARPTRASRLGGMAGKELRLLVRDRSYLVQVLVLPVMVAGFQLIVNARASRAALGDIRHLSAMVYGVMCYGLVMPAARLLSGESRSLWLVFTLPRGIGRILLGKAAVWAAAFGALSLVMLAAMGAWGGLGAGQITLAALAVVPGVAVFGLIASSIGTLRCDPFAKDPQQAVTPGFMFGSLLLASIYGATFYVDSLWQKGVALILFGVAALGCWQAVSRAAPFLLDPTERPRADLTLAHALLAVFAFFGLQSVLLVGLMLAGVEMAAAVTMSYAFAGAIVAAVSMGLLLRVPHILERLGLRRAVPHRMGLLPAAGLALVLGAISGGCALGYLALMSHVPWLDELRRSTPSAFQEAGRSAWTLALLAVALAPLLEEYLFRGLLLGALGVVLRPWAAILASAVLFAIVHPPISFPAVFIMGLLAALVYRRTGWLMAPIIVHALHNGMAVLLAR